MGRFVICEYINRKSGGINYKYLVEEVGSHCTIGRTAFFTTKGFKQFCEVYNLKVSSPIEKLEDGMGETYLLYRMQGSYIVDYFYKFSEIPRCAKKFVVLENGICVYGYYCKADYGHLILIPNCNSKEVYKPLNYSKMVKLYG